MMTNGQVVLVGLLRLAALGVEGKNDSEEARLLRDLLDEPYRNLSKEERDAVEELSVLIADVEKIVAH